MRVLVQVVYALGIEAAGPTFDAVDDVALFEQKFGKIRAVLASDAGNKGDFLFC